MDGNLLQAPQLLSNFITIRQNGVRSVNIEQDLSNDGIASGYVVTAQSRGCLDRILSQLNGASPHRAWTLTGPYGSGKSYFSLFLVNLLCPSQKGHRKALSQLKLVDQSLAEKVKDEGKIQRGRGFLPIAITGHRASFQECLLQGLRNTLDPLSTESKLDALLKQLESKTTFGDSRALVIWLQNLLSVLTSPSYNYTGLILVFDEMGKPLEYAAAHPDSTDIYLLQELAEFANRSGEHRFLFIGVLHQAFERYAVLMDSTTQREWAKVQGRFEDIAFTEPPTQQMRLLANALEYSDNTALYQALTAQRSASLLALESGWLPPTMKDDEFIELGQRTYPFHPTTLVALPHVFRRLAQNERSIFAFLASHEPFGVREFLETHTVPQVIRLPDLFDYLSANFQGRLYASGQARPLTETLERLNNSIHLNELEANLLKCIGLLNWLGKASHLQATEACLLSALGDSPTARDEIRQALNNLRQRSIIAFRRYNSTYIIWQGSDVDIEEQLQRAQEQMTGAFSLAATVQKYMPPRPLVARRHSYQTGTTRFFEVHYLDAQTRDAQPLTPAPGASGLIFICLPTNAAETEAFREWAQNRLKGCQNVLVGVAKHTLRLTELLNELRYLNWVRENTPELRDDPVARKELRNRISDVEILIRGELDRSISLHRLSDSAGCDWYWHGDLVLPQAGRSLSYLLSTICTELYSKSPRIWNELINRQLLSTQAAAARRNLIEAMLTHADQPNLGIEGYPPERSMYESLLKASGLHSQKSSSSWHLTAPSADNPLHLQHVWSAISEFIFTPLPEPRSVSELFQRLSNPPYGVSDGVLPVLLCAFLSAYPGETTLYREGTLLPDPGVPDWEVLLRRPELFSVAGCQVVGTRAAIVQRIARGLRTEPKVMAVVRALVRQLRTLPEYAWRTSRLPQTALAFRRAIETAHSPEKLLFQDLPLALGLQPVAEDVLDQEYLDAFFNALNQALDTLSQATQRRREWARDILLRECNLPSGAEGWKALIEMAGVMAPSAQQPALQALLKRIADAPDETAGEESALALIANRPVRTWTDFEVDRFPQQAHYYGQLLQSEQASALLELHLSPAEQARSQELTLALEEYLHQHAAEDPRVLQSAVQQLLARLRCSGNS